jgi:hypothetical protein
MFLDTLSEAEGYFDLSSKTDKSHLEHALDTAASERAMRGARATLTVQSCQLDTYPVQLASWDSKVTRL